MKVDFRAVLVVGGAMVVCLCSPASGDVPAGEQFPPGSSITEQETLGKLRELARAGKPKAKEILALIVGKDLSGRSFPFQKELLTTQADAHRQSGQLGAARNCFQQLLESARKLPEPEDRVRQVRSTLFPIGLYKCVRADEYVSPRRAENAPAGEPPPSWPIDDDTGWERAKEDYAQYSLGRIDGRLKVAVKGTNLGGLTKDLFEMLDLTDVVRPWVPDLANRKAGQAATQMTERFDQVVQGRKCLSDAQSLQNGTLWPKGFMRLAERPAIAERIVREVRRVCVDNHALGDRLTDWARLQDCTGAVSAAISVVATRREALQRDFVDVENYVQRNFRFLRLGERPADPLSKIPTGKW